MGYATEWFKLAATRIKREIYSGRMPQEQIDGLRQQGYLKSPEHFAAGLQRGNMALEKKHRVNYWRNPELPKEQPEIINTFSSFGQPTIPRGSFSIGAMPANTAVATDWHNKQSPNYPLTEKQVVENLRRANMKPGRNTIIQAPGYGMLPLTPPFQNYSHSDWDNLRRVTNRHELHEISQAATGDIHNSFSSHFGPQIVAQEGRAMAMMPHSTQTMSVPLRIANIEHMRQRGQLHNAGVYSRPTPPTPKPPPAG